MDSNKFCEIKNVSDFKSVARKGSTSGTATIGIREKNTQQQKCTKTPSKNTKTTPTNYQKIYLSQPLALPTPACKNTSKIF